MTILITNYTPIHLQNSRLWRLLVQGFRSTPKKRIFNGQVCSHQVAFEKYLRTHLQSFRKWCTFTPNFVYFSNSIGNSLTFLSFIYSKTATYLFVDQNSRKYKDNFNTPINQFQLTPSAFAGVGLSLDPEGKFMSS